MFIWKSWEDLQIGDYQDDWTQSSPTLEHTFQKALKTFDWDQDEMLLRLNSLYNDLGPEAGLKPVAKQPPEECR